jgi:hypothetical protein
MYFDTEINKDQLVKEFIRFMIMKVAYQDYDKNDKLSPSYYVDEMWHTLLLSTKLYKEFCTFLSIYLWDNNKFVHHDPDTKVDSTRDDRYRKTLLEYEQCFGSAPTSHIWPPEENASIPNLKHDLFDPSVSTDAKD